jgi:hypothetical protein
MRLRRIAANWTQRSFRSGNRVGRVAPAGPALDHRAQSTEETTMSLRTHASLSRLPARAALLLCGLLGAGALGSAPAAAAETPRVDAVGRTTLPGHRLRWASAANDRGAVPAALELTQLRLSLKRSPERQQAFDAYLREQRDPASPNYQRWLTPSEIGERFGATQADVDAVSAWLRGQGLRVDSVANSRMRIQFSGSAAAVGAAFGTQLRYYQAAGAAKRMAPADEPRIPAALAGSIDAVLDLSPARFEPQFRLGARNASADAAQPALSLCDGGACDHYVTPGDFSKIYNLPGNLDGSGQSIAILGRARVYDTDIQSFGLRTGVTMKTPTVIVPPDGVDPGPAATTCSTTGTPSCDDPSETVKDQSEATLDVTRAGSVAPGADIKLIVSGHRGDVDGINYVIDYAIDHEPLPAKIISISFGSCEAGNSQATANALDQLFAQGAMQGQSIFVSSGDAGAADCADYFTAPAADLSRSTNILCSSGHVTCVGGTSFGLGTDQHWSSTNGPGYVSASGYIPEGAWNEPHDADGNLQAAPPGGGVSTYIAKPAWQNAPGVPGSAGRYVPDVSFGASSKNGYFGCMAASQGSCVPGADNRFGFLIWGGTSASAPSMAGIAAMLNQGRGAAQGNLNPTLYALGSNAGNGIFHDVTVQSSGVSGCSVGTASLCNNSLPSPSGLSGGLQGYAVGPGYDLATGLGSLDASRLIAQWGSAPVAVNLNQHGLTGSWISSQADSQGWLLEIYPDLAGPGRGVLFGGWFTFDVTAAGGVRWYTIQGDVDSSSASATVPIYLTKGGRFGSSQATSTQSVGQVTLRFDDCANAELDYQFSDGSARSGSQSLTRLTAPITCSPGGDNGAPASSYLLSGAWGDPAHTNQGLILDVNPAQNVFFAAWYTFSTTGQTGSGPSAQRWFTLQTAMTPGSTRLDDVPIYVSSGGVFDQPADTTTTAAGQADIVFHSCSSATLTYRFDGGSGFPSSGTLNLARVGPTPAGCSL